MALHRSRAGSSAKTREGSHLEKRKIPIYGFLLMVAVSVLSSFHGTVLVIRTVQLDRQKTEEHGRVLQLQTKRGFHDIVEHKTLEDKKLDAVDDNVEKQSAQKNSSREEKSSVVHVIHTRFQQFQPNLVTLGFARLKLFESITLPSLRHQSSQNFLYIMRTDPQLHPSVLRPLLAAVKDVPNVLVLASNRNPTGFGDAPDVRQIVEDKRTDMLLSGDRQLLSEHYWRSKNSTLLVTRIDSDDGFHRDFVKILQQKQPAAVNNKDWRVWCVRDVEEWQTHPDMFMLRPEKKLCISAGLTYVFGPGTGPHNLPATAHNKIHSTIPDCSEERPSHCRSFLHLPDQAPAVLRARTLTSAGMKDVVFAYNEKSDDASMRKALPDLFGGVSIDHLKDSRDFLEKNVAIIAQEALAGQCIRGFTCKDSTKKTLSGILAIEKELRADK
jgi:hypothetical protein